MRYKRFSLRESKNLLPFIVAIFTAIMAISVLFVGDIAGVADDGSLATVMDGAGISYDEDDGATIDYFVDRYIWKNSIDTSNVNLQIIIIRIAKELSYLVTGTHSFDIRYLAGIYLFFYLPAVFMITKSAISRTERPGSKIAISLIAALIFSDTGYITYFNSFYPEAIIYITLLYIAAAALRCVESDEKISWNMMILTFATGSLCFIRHYFYMAGLIVALFFLVRIGACKERRFKISMILGAALSVVFSVASLFFLKTDFTDADKLHAMTRGVLFQAEDPEAALADFGIDPSYSLLTDISAFEQLPMTSGYAETLYNGFYDKYDTLDLLSYYLKHPQDAMSMLNIAVNSNIEIVRENCGSFTRSSSRQPGARILLGSYYSFLKNRSFPKTFGYFAVLIIVSFVLGKSEMSLLREKDEKKRIFFNTTATLIVMGLVFTMNILIHAGDSGFTRFNCELGIVMDILLFYILAELLDRLNIFKK